MFVNQLQSLMVQAAPEQHSGEIPPGPRPTLQGVTGGVIPQGGPMIAQHAIPGVATQTVPPAMVPDRYMADPIIRQKIFEAAQRGEPLQLGYPGRPGSFAFSGQLPEVQLMQLRGTMGRQRPQQAQAQQGTSLPASILHGIVDAAAPGVGSILQGAGRSYSKTAAQQAKGAEKKKGETGIGQLQEPQPYTPYFARQQQAQANIPATIRSSSGEKSYQKQWKGDVVEPITGLTRKGVTTGEAYKMVGDARLYVAGLEQKEAQKYHREVLKARKQMEADMGLVDAKGRMEIADILNQRARVSEEYEQARRAAAQEKVDPNAWWSSRTGGQKAAMVIAMALGGFTEGFTQGRVKNIALRIMESEINRDLEAQRLNIGKKAGERREMLGVLSSLESRLGNEETRLANAKIMLEQDLARRLQTIAMQVKDPTLAKGLIMSRAAIQEDLVNKNQAMMPNIKSRWASRTNPQLLQTLQKKQLPDDVLKEAARLKVGENELHRMREMFKKIAAKGVVGGIGKALKGFGWWTDEGVYKRWKDKVIISLAAVDNQGRPTEPDAKAMFKGLPSLKDPVDVALKKIDEIFLKRVTMKRRAMDATFGQAGHETSPIWSPITSPKMTPQQRKETTRRRQAEAVPPFAWEAMMGGDK